MDVQSRSNAPAFVHETSTAARVQALRKALGLTQDKLADRARIRRTEINRVERGKNLATSHALREALARGFELELAHLDAYLSGAITVERAKGYSGETTLTATLRQSTLDRAVSALGPRVAPPTIEAARREQAKRERRGLVDMSETEWAWWMSEHQRRAG